MTELDKLDSKILSVLDEDARLAESTIGKKVGTSKQVVKYRLKRLQEKGIIENYYTMLDVGTIGFDSYYVFVQLTGLNSTKEAEIYKKISKLPYLAWIVTGVGRWDAVFLFCAQNIAQFNSQLEEMKEILGSNLREYIFTNLIKAEHLSYKFLRTAVKDSLKTTPKNKTSTLDETDKKILEKLNQHARAQVTEISEKTSIPVYTVHHRLKQLIKNNIIQGFRPKVNINKLGLQWHLLLIKFNSVSEEKIKSFLNYCKNHNQVYYATNTVGNYNLMLDIHVKSSEEFRKFLFDIKNAYGDVILMYESIVVFEELALNYIPSIITN